MKDSKLSFGTMQCIIKDVQQNSETYPDILNCLGRNIDEFNRMDRVQKKSISNLIEECELRYYHKSKHPLVWLLGIIHYDLFHNRTVNGNIVTRIKDELDFYMLKSTVPIVSASNSKYIDFVDCGKPGYVIDDNPDIINNFIILSDVTIYNKIITTRKLLLCRSINESPPNIIKVRVSTENGVSEKTFIQDNKQRFLYHLVDVNIYDTYGEDIQFETNPTTCSLPNPSIVNLLDEDNTYLNVINLTGSGEIKVVNEDKSNPTPSFRVKKYIIETDNYKVQVFKLVK